MIDKIMNIYDIEVIEGKIVVTLYEAFLVNLEQNGKVKSFYNFQLTDTLYTDDLEELIRNLRNEGFESANVFEKEYLNEIIIPNYLKSVQLTFLAKNMRIIEKVYSEEKIENESYIYTYIVYINMKTGAKYVLPIGNIGAKNEVLMRKLEIYGYVNIIDSSINQLSKLDTISPIKLERKINN